MEKVVGSQVRLTIATPCLSARVMYTQKVDMTTEMRGAIAETQKSFLFFLAWIIPVEQHDHHK